MTTSWSGRIKPVTNWTSRFSYLLTQASFYLLLQDGGRIIISMHEPGQTVWTGRVKP